MQKHIKKWPFVAFTMLLALLSACEKDLQPQTVENKSPESWEKNIINREGEPITVLGSIRSNPYAVETMRQAYNNLYNPDISSLSPNYLYVRFLPQSPENVKSLLDSDLEL